MAAFIDSMEAARLLDQGALVVDVRTPEEWERGHGPDSVLIPLDELADRLDELPKDRPLLLCCHSGGRSAHAAGWLGGQGYEAHNLGPWQRNPRCSA